MLYFDTSYIVRLYWDDPGFQPVRDLAATDAIVCCLNGRAETVSAFHRKRREGRLTQAQLATVITLFERECAAGAITWLPLSPAVVDRLLRVYVRLPATVSLRAADAIHLACAAENQLAAVYSNDQALLQAASYFGLTARNII